jgi:hypothetical protein
VKASTPMIFDDDAVAAVADLVSRTGATSFQVGFLHDDVPAEEAGWYAVAQYRGARITIEDQRGPIEACDALARRLLAGARCTKCGRTITLTAKRAGCRWRRLGAKWVAGCDPRAKDLT